MLDEDLQQLADSGAWRALTAVPEKFRYFTVESSFRESWALTRNILGSDALTALQRIAVVTVKPDGILTRAADTVLRFIVEHGFRPVAVRPFRYGRATSREIWRYQWNIATLDRLQVADAVHACAPALMFFLADDRPAPGIPASVRLAGLKGPAQPAERAPHQLRSRLPASNRMIVSVHCSDEPIDIVRETGILFSAKSQAQLFRQLRSRKTVDAQSFVDRIHRQIQPGHRRVDDALAEFDDMLAAVVPGSSTQTLAAKRAAAAIREAQSGEHLCWADWTGDLCAAGAALPPWTTAFLGSQYIRHDIPGATCLIDESGRERWLAGEGIALHA